MKTTPRTGGQRMVLSRHSSSPGRGDKVYVTGPPGIFALQTAITTSLYCMLFVVQAGNWGA